jgi:hypothetical protein
MTSPDVHRWYSVNTEAPQAIRQLLDPDLVHQRSDR